MRSLKLALGFMLTATAAAAQSYPSPTYSGVNVTAGGTYKINSIPLLGLSGVNATLPGVSINGTRGAVSGTLQPVIYSSGNYYGTTTTTFNYLNNLSANSYTVNDTSAGGAYNLLVGTNIDTGQKGNHTVINGLAVLNTPSSNAPTDNKFYVGNAGQFIGKVSDNGASVSVPAGNGFGGNWRADLNSGALYWKSLVGGEIDLAAKSGSSVFYKAGLQIVSDVGDAVQGSASDFALGFAKASGSIGFKKLISFSAVAGDWPLSSGGTLIGTEASALPSPTAYTAAYGVDLRAVTFSSAAFASTGFSVDGSGNVSSASVNIPTGSSYKVNNVAGVSCAAGTVNLATLVVSGGIITHC
jgi:hypothetical protein